MSEYKHKKYQHKCFVCEKDFGHNHPNAKFCSKECLGNYNNSRHRKRVVGEKLPTGTVGAISELIISANLMSYGYSVFRALSPSCYCDIIASKDGETHHIEVRTGYKSSEGKWYFPTKRSGTVDVFGVVERNTLEIVYFDINLKEISLW